ncbi:MAG: DUF4290 domain-containing protein [Chitinophagaceae bacterium]
MQYNTTRNHLIMREYGRHIQRMVEYLMSIEDKETRQRNAYVVIELMGFLNPHLKNVEDFRHKLWDHLFLISDFKLDVESPYPIPTRETLKARPENIPYPKGKPRYSHLGKHLERVIHKGLQEENPEKKAGFANAVAYYMKLAYQNWHKESVHDDAIRGELDAITGGGLEFTNTPAVKAPQQHFRQNDNRNYNDFRNKRNQKFQPRGGNNQGGGNQGNNRDRNNQGNSGGNRNNQNNQNNKFNKKRFK